MAISTYITSIETSRNTIRNKLVELGLATSTSKLDALAAIIEDIINQGAVNVSVKEGESYTIPKGWHNGSGTVKGVSGGGNYTLQTKQVTPTKKQQSVVSDEGYYGLSGVTVLAIPEAYQDVSSVTAAAEHVLSGKIIVLADGTVEAGSMPNIGAVSGTVSATSISYTIPKGYHDGTGTVKLTVEAKTVTPTKSTQEITPAAGKVLSKVTVGPIPDEYQDVSGVTATADDVLSGKSIVTADGTMSPGKIPIAEQPGAITMALNTTGEVTTEWLLDAAAYVPAGAKRTSSLQLPTVPAGTITPAPVEQTVVASNKYTLGEITVGPIPDRYQDVSGVTTEARNVLEGTVFVDAEGNEVEGTMKNNGSASKTFDGLTTTYVVIPTGYTSGGMVSLTSDIEDALAAI